MGFEVWIVIVLAASGLSGWIGYAYARKGAPKQSDLDALAAELDEARSTSESVQTNVNEHFEQSALLFGKLAADYREFLDHFSSSAQSLGLSESRARELIEQGFQPLLTHEGETVEAEETTDPAVSAPAEESEAVTEAVSEVSDVTVEMPEDVPAVDSTTDEEVEAELKKQEAAETDSSSATTDADCPSDAESEAGTGSEAENAAGDRQRSA